MSMMNLLFLFCLSIHACNARCLSIVDAKESGKECHIFTKDVETKSFQQYDEKTLTHEESKALLKEDQGSNTATSGDRTAIPSLKDVPGTTEMEEMINSQARYLLESSPHETDETVDSKENDAVEEIVVMDYAQPHRKPPIHNEKH